MIDPLNNIIVIGQGAMGLLWYHHLSQANTHTSASPNVSLLSSNQAQLNAYELKSAKYQFTPYQQQETSIYPITYAKTADIKRANIILLCVKSYHIASALKNIAKDIPHRCMVILAHNGMGTFEEAAELLPSNQPILAMLTTHGCLRRGVLNIEHTGLGYSDVGLLSGEISTNQQNKLSNVLSHALPEVTFHQNIIEKQWLKLAINCVINPITAINDIDNGEVNNEKYTEQVNQLLAEIVAISHNEGINLVLADLQKTVFKVASATAKNCSSMRCDILAGKPSEIDYINGYIHRLGKHYQIATPENTRLWQQVKSLNA